MTLSHGVSRIQESTDAHQPSMLGQDPDEKDHSIRIQNLRQALSNEMDLKSRLDDKFLLKFLRARKFDHDRALALVKSYYKQRIKYPGFYRNMRFASFPEVIATKGLGKLSNKDSEGRTVFFGTNTADWDPSKLPVLDIVACALMALELAVEDEEAQVNGFVFLMDATGFSLNHLRAFDPFVIAQIISVTWNSFPAKFKGVHIINPPYYFKVFFSMLKPFLTQKLKRRFKFHGPDFGNLYEFLPREILPEEFGGHLGPLDGTEWNTKLLHNDQVLERDRIYGYLVDC